MLDKLLSNSIYRNYREHILFLIDMIIVFISMTLAHWLKMDFMIQRFFFHKNILPFSIIVLVVFALSFYIFHIHKSLWRYVGIKEVFNLSMSVICAALILCVISCFFTLKSYLISISLLTGIISILLMSNIRLMYRLLRSHKSLEDKGKVKNAVIIGAGDGGYILLKELLQNEDMDVKVVGFVDDRRAGMIVSGVKVLGQINDLSKIVRDYNVKIGYIAIPSASKEEKKRIIDVCQAIPLEVKMLKAGENMLVDKDTKKSIQDVSIEDLLGRGEIKLEQKEISSYLTDKVVAVTGAGGSIGSELCRQIVRFKPKELLMIDINENGLYMLEQEFNRNRVHGSIDENIVVRSYVASIRDYTAISSIFNSKKPEVVYHAAAHKHVPLMETRPMEAIKNNVFGTNNVIKACLAAEVKRFIMISTDKAVNPTNVMGATKRMTEMILQSYGNNGVTKMAAVRFGNVLGSNGSVIPIFKNQIKEGGPVTITHKDITRYFMTIPEAAQLVLQAGYYADKGEIFVLDMGEPVKILDLAEKLIRLSGFKPYQEIDIVEVGLRPGEKMYEELQLGNERRHKTKNNLIFANEVMNISREAVDEKLEILSNALSKTDLPKEEYRNLILELIKDEEIA